MKQKVNTAFSNEASNRRGAVAYLQQYLPIVMAIVTGVMLTIIVLRMVTVSEWSVLFAGISFTCLFTAYLVLLLGRTAEIERTVVKRTAELENEITERKQAEKKIRDQYDDIEIYASELEAANNELQQTQERLLESNLSLEEKVNERTSRLEDANNELEAFIYSVSHDLRAPLRHINGYSGMLESEFDDQLSNDAKRYLKKISESTSMMGALIDGLLNLSRISRKKLEMKPVNLRRMVNDVREELEADMVDRNVEWKIGSLPEITCDPVLMKVVATNLLSNAIKFSSKSDHAVIQINPLPDGKPGFMVSDNGAGFNMEYADKLFGVFERLHSKRDFDGTGIGLATVQRIVVNHNGRVWAEAEMDKGATFHVELAPTPAKNEEV